jgi:predicted enzyme related to lactoylglutathione lyase
MLSESKVFSSFSVNNQEDAKKFYQQTLGLDVSEVPDMEGLLNLNISGTQILIYSKPDHVPATFTIMNFIVNNVETTVKALHQRGIRFEIYDEPEFKTDSHGIFQGIGPKIAWFKDPAGNILSIIES